MSIDLRSVKRSVWLVRDENGQLVDPSSATATVTVGMDSRGDGPVTLPPATQGTLIADHLTAKPGLHRINWVTAGPVTPRRRLFQRPAILSVFGLDEAASNPRALPGRLLYSRVSGSVGGRDETADRSSRHLCYFLPVAPASGANGDARTVLQVAAPALPSSICGLPKLCRCGRRRRVGTGPDLIVTACRRAGSRPWRDFSRTGGGAGNYTAGRVRDRREHRQRHRDILWDLFSRQRPIRQHGRARRPLRKPRRLSRWSPPGMRCRRTRRNSSNVPARRLRLSPRRRPPVARARGMCLVSGGNFLFDPETVAILTWTGRRGAGLPRLRPANK